MIPEQGDCKTVLVGDEKRGIEKMNIVFVHDWIGGGGVFGHSE